MVWGINRVKSTAYNLTDDVLIQKTNIFLTIHKPIYNAFDLYYYWQVGVNVFNIDMTVHDIEYLNNAAETIQQARIYNSMKYYRPIGVAVTLSAIDNIDIGEEICDNVDILVLKDVTKKEHIMQFRKKNQKLTAKPTLVWISDYGLDDLKMIIKISDGVILDFFKENRVLQPICSALIQYCREVHKPIIIYRPALIKSYLNPQRELLPVMTPLSEMSMDGLLLEDNIEEDATDEIYNVFCALYYTEKLREKNVSAKEIYFQKTSKLKVPVIPPLAAALGASLTAIYTDAKAIMVLTRTGRSVRWVSCAAPPCPVLAITTQPGTARLLHVCRKVIPLLYNHPSVADDKTEYWKRIAFAKEFCVSIGVLNFGDNYVVMIPEGNYGYCNRVEVTKVP